MVRRKKLRKSVLAVMMALCLLCGTVQTSAVVYATDAEEEEVIETPSDDGEPEANEEEASDKEDSEEQTSEDGASEEEDEADDETGDESGNADENENTDSGETGDSEQVEDSSVSNLTEGESDDKEDSIETDQGEAASDSSDDGSGEADSGSNTALLGDLEESGSKESNIYGISLMAAAEEEETTVNNYDLSSNGAVTIKNDGAYSNSSGKLVTSSTDGMYMITGTYEMEDDDIAAITVEENVTAIITLENVDITIEGVNGTHKAAIYIKNGAEVELILQGTSNKIVGDNLPDITNDSSTGVIGIWVGGTPADSAATGSGSDDSNDGKTSLTISGSGTLSISEVGTGISITAKNSCEISGATVLMNNIKMLDTTISGIGIYNNGTLKITNAATLTINNVNTQDENGTYIDYNNGYGISSRNEGGIEITGKGTKVTIENAYRGGIYSSDATGSSENNYVKVGNGASLSIDGGSISSYDEFSGISMESNGLVSVYGGATVDIQGTLYGIEINHECLIEVDGDESVIRIHDLLDHKLGSYTNKITGIYAGENSIINVKNNGEISLSNIKEYGINFEVGTSTNEIDGVFVFDKGKLSIADSGAGIYVMGGTTSIEFTNGATVYMDVTGNCIGSDANDPTGHVLMSGEGTTVNLTGGYVFSLNYKYLKIAEQAVVNVTAAGDAISLGDWKNGGASLLVTGDAKLAVKSGANTGIATYGASHYVEISDGGTVTMTGEDGTGILLSKPTELYVFNATLLIENTNGIVVSGTDNLLYEDSLSHIEATNVYSDDEGKMDFIVMGGTLTYDFNHENNIWPYNTLSPVIGSIEEEAYGVNDTALERSITYGVSEALVNFIVPNNTAHCSFSAYGWNGNNAVTYDYISDTDKEKDTLSIWVPGVKIYYNVDEDSEYTTLQGVTLTDESAAEFELQGENDPLNYDVVIRGQSINFSVNADGDSQYALPAVTNGELEDYTKDARAVYYPTTFTTSDGSTKYINWFYNKTTDYGPLTSFSKSSNVVRGSLEEIATANVYGILSDTEPAAEESPEIDKTATSLDGNNQTTVTLTIGAGSEQENVAVLFLLDKSTSTAVQQAATDMLLKLADKENTNILYDVVVFSGTADSSGWTSNLTLNDDNVAIEFVERDQTSGTNMSAGILQAIEDMKTLAEDYPEYDKTYLVTVSDGITYYWSVSGDETAYAVAVQAYGNSGNIENKVQTGTDTWKMMYNYGMSIEDVYESFGSFLNSISGKMDATIAAGAVVSVGTSTSTPLSTYVYDANAKAEVASQYACGPEFALYYSATYYKELLTYFDYSYAFAMPETTSDGSDNEINWANFPWGKELMQYCQSLSTNSNWALSYSNNDATAIFDSILDEILYQIQSGTITDVIGADFTLTDAGAITDSTFILTVEGLAATVTSVSGNVVTFNNGDFVLTYYQGTTMDNGNGTYTITATDGTTYTYIPCETGDEINGAVSDEFFTLEINIPIGALELTYNLTLTSLQTLDGTYTVPTNETAVLEYTSSDGTEGEEEFPEPTVGYEVEDTTVTPTDPTPDPGTSETSTETSTETTTETSAETTDPQETVSTVASEVVSAVTGDNAPIGIAILLAAISEITLITLIVLQMRKKRNSVI